MFSGVVGVKFQSPLLSTSAVPSRLPLSNTCTEVPGSPLPDRVGVVSSVEPPLAIGPWMPPTSSLTASMASFEGALRSTVSANGSVRGLSPVAVVVTVAVS
ncbi:hypothetical protein D9M72_641460 [compost metagenome]